MRALKHVAEESFFILIRGQVFFGTLAFMFLMIYLANVSSYWSVAEFDKIFFDVGFFAIHLVGNVVAVLWGVKLVAEARERGSHELALVTPLSRSLWILGKFAGLAAALLLVAVLTLCFWQLVMLLGDFGWLGKNITLFFIHMLSWWVLGALAVLFSTFCNPTTALFASGSCGLVGLLLRIIYENLPPDMGPWGLVIIKFLTSLWDLQRFNLVSLEFTNGLSPLMNCFWITLYGFSLVGFFLSLASYTFERRDLI